jgi:predicted short-subunit dehydrogenase-like oxidoreductase (DUF2520 family)
LLERDDEGAAAPPPALMGIEPLLVRESKPIIYHLNLNQMTSAITAKTIHFALLISLAVR